MDKDKVVDLSGRRAEAARERRNASLVRFKPPARMVAFAVFGAIFIAGYLWSGPSGLLQKAAPSGVVDHRAPIAACGWIRRTCLVDGDTGWQDGVKWRLVDVDAPEVRDAACSRERELAAKSLERLGALMANGYKVEWRGRKDRYSRELVAIRLPNGKDAGQTLINEGLAQTWPNTGNVWCDR